MGQGLSQATAAPCLIHSATHFCAAVTWMFPYHDYNKETLLCLGTIKVNFIYCILNITSQEAKLRKI